MHLQDYSKHGPLPNPLLYQHLFSRVRQKHELKRSLGIETNPCLWLKTILYEYTWGKKGRYLLVLSTSADRDDMLSLSVLHWFLPPPEFWFQSGINNRRVCFPLNKVTSLIQKDAYHQYKEESADHGAQIFHPQKMPIQLGNKSLQKETF